MHVAWVYGKGAPNIIYTLTTIASNYINLHPYPPVTYFLRVLSRI